MHIITYMQFISFTIITTRLFLQNILKNKFSFDISLENHMYNKVASLYTSFLGRYFSTIRNASCAVLRSGTVGPLAIMSKGSPTTSERTKFITYIYIIKYTKQYN